MKACIVLILVVIILIIRFPTICLQTKVVLPNIKLINKPHFFICTHKYEHIDIYSIIELAKKWREHTQRSTFFVVADYPHNHLLNIQTKLCMNPVNFLYVTKNTVAKIVNKLQHFHVCIFMYEDNKNTGIYYVLKKITGPVTLVNISSNAKPCENHAAFPCIYNTYGKEFHVSYKDGNILKKWVNESMNPHDFISNMKEVLY